MQKVLKSCNFQREIGKESKEDMEKTHSYNNWNISFETNCESLFS